MQFTTLVDIAGRRRSPAGQLGIAAHCCVAGDPGEKLGRVAGDRRRPQVSSSVADGIRVLPRPRWLTRLIVSPLREPGLVGSRAAGDCFSRNLGGNRAERRWRRAASGDYQVHGRLSWRPALPSTR
jgi:hypothetical protein